MQTITRGDLKAKMERGDEFVLLEVAGEPAYRRAHLPGAIQFQDMERIPEILPDKDAFVVAYCSNFT